MWRQRGAAALPIGLHTRDFPAGAPACEAPWAVAGRRQTQGASTLKIRLVDPQSSGGLIMNGALVHSVQCGRKNGSKEDTVLAGEKLHECQTFNDKALSLSRDCWVARSSQTDRLAVRRFRIDGLLPQAALRPFCWGATQPARSRSLAGLRPDRNSLQQGAGRQRPRGVGARHSWRQVSFPSNLAGSMHQAHTAAPGNLQ